MWLFSCASLPSKVINYTYLCCPEKTASNYRYQYKLEFSDVFFSVLGKGPGLRVQSYWENNCLVDIKIGNSTPPPKKTFIFGVLFNILALFDFICILCCNFEVNIYFSLFWIGLHVYNFLAILMLCSGLQFGNFVGRELGKYAFILNWERFIYQT